MNEKIIANCGRQNGKTLTIANEIVKLINAGKTVTVLSLNNATEVARITRCKKL